MSRVKIALIGGGQIGQNLALLAAQRNIPEIVVFDIFESMAQGKSLDLNQLCAISGSDSQITGTQKFSDIQDADVCIITAGIPRKPGMSREDLLEVNLKAVKSVAEGIKKYAPNALVIMVTNPIDSMVYAFQQMSGLPTKKIIGMAGVLDSARFCTFLAWELGVSRDDVTALVLGGHGDDMVPLVRYSTVGGIPLPTLVEMGMLSATKLDEIVQRTRMGGGEIVKLLGNGSAFFAPAQSAMQMADSYLNNKKRLLPCAAYLQGEYGVHDMFLGVPVIIGSEGIEKIIELPLNAQEKSGLERSINSVAQVVAEVKKLL